MRFCPGAYVCVRMNQRVHQFACRAHMSVFACGACDESKKAKPSSKQLRDAMEAGSLFGCHVIFPINHS